jgi:SAM-dependent methyltransferase
LAGKEAESMTSTHASGAGVAEQIRADYEVLEPGRADAWNPVGSSFELVYRLGLLHAVTQALRLVEIRVRELRVLDIGCGNGRSTRMYLDLGLHPDQLTGLDVRPGAIDLARTLNPSIRFDVYDGEKIPFPDGAFTWIHVSTVVSSIKTHKHRLELAARITEKLRPGGYVFYFDLIRANDFAGHDTIRPEALFPGLEVVSRHAYDSWRFMQELDARSYNPFYLNYCRLKKLLFPAKSTHEALLLEKPR